MSRNPSLRKKINIMQTNPNKPEKAHPNVINSPQLRNWDIILIQEPHLTFLSNIHTPNWFTSVASTSHLTLDDMVCSVIWVNLSLTTNS
jgi:hypothetical protein